MPFARHRTVASPGGGGGGGARLCGALRDGRALPLAAQRGSPLVPTAGAWVRSPSGSFYSYNTGGRLLRPVQNRCGNPHASDLSARTAAARATPRLKLHGQYVHVWSGEWSGSTLVGSWEPLVRLPARAVVERRGAGRGQFGAADVAAQRSPQPTQVPSGREERHRVCVAVL